MERQPPNASTGGASAQFGYSPKPCDIATGRFSVQTLLDHESRVAVVTRDSNVLKDWIYPGAQQHRDFMSGNVRSMPYNARVFALPGSGTCLSYAGELRGGVGTGGIGIFLNPW